MQDFHDDPRPTVLPIGALRTQTSVFVVETEWVLSDRDQGVTRHLIADKEIKPVTDCMSTTILGLALFDINRKAADESIDNRHNPFTYGQFGQILL